VSEIADLLAEFGMPVTNAPGGEAVVTVPSERRGAVTVAIARNESALRLQAFVLRAPDRAHADVYRRLLRKNFHTRSWRFALDAAGDVFAVADATSGERLAERLDAMLGELAMLVDEVYEGLVRTGFNVPDGARIGPPPGAQ
jgi:hypothetical protein